ncbi:hypothetical protein AAFF_G00227580 [Aldrovandia affinis]|uniref:Uncharacterized protein n=1 Tax=Aldrovandia affinis TaxID=143900 RepID=A0AAD7X2I7_9TELE|nr:hypothetical protein AAFF_G00227580 [Aldrovandia affinis]
MRSGGGVKGQYYRKDRSETAQASPHWSRAFLKEHGHMPLLFHQWAGEGLHKQPVGSQVLSQRGSYRAGPIKRSGDEACEGQSEWESERQRGHWVCAQGLLQLEGIWNSDLTVLWFTGQLQPSLMFHMLTIVGIQVEKLTTLTNN